MGRVWQTPPGQAIALSVVLYPDMLPTQVPLLSLATGLAVIGAVEAVAGPGLDLGLKWPNDIFLNGKKLGGVLVEMAAELDRVSWVIDSIGLNVNNVFSGTELSGTATSLAVELGRKVPRRDLAAALLQELDDVYELVRTAEGIARIRREFKQWDLLQGHKVEVSTPGGAVKGIAMGIDEEGRLIVRGAGGGTTALFSGEATLSGSGKLL